MHTTWCLLGPAARSWTRPDRVRAVLHHVQLKALLNAVYFGADHVVWASQAGLTTNKALVDRAQKVVFTIQGLLFR